MECLSSLLTNKDDHHVGDGALKCFASLADRFIRKNVDPLPLASNGLTQELLNRLAHAGQVTSTSSAAEVCFSNDFYFTKMFWFMKIILDLQNLLKITVQLFAVKNEVTNLFEIQIHPKVISQLKAKYITVFFFKLSNFFLLHYNCLNKIS